MPIQTAEQARRVFKTPRDLTRTDAGRVRREMTDLQRQTDLNKADTGRLKELRRDWNRNLKYTREGMALSGATSPLDAQNRFMRSTETFRQANPRAYGKMYPLSQAAMKLGEYGGLLGLGIRGLTGQLGDYYKDIMNKDGINAALDTNEAELENYANLTYGPHLEGIEELDFTDEYAGRLPHEGLPTIKEQITDLDLPPITDELWDSIRDFDLETIEGGGKRHSGEDITVPDWLTDPSVPMPEELTEGEYLPGQYHDELIEEEVPVALPPYQGREFGLGQFMDTMPRDWQDYLEDMQRVGDVEGGYHKNKMTYEEWHDIMRRRR